MKAGNNADLVQAQALRAVKNLQRKPLIKKAKVGSDSALKISKHVGAQPTVPNNKPVGINPLSTGAKSPNGSQNWIG